MVRCLRMVLVAAALAAAGQGGRAEEHDAPPPPFAALEPGAAYVYEFVSGRVTTLTLARRDESGTLWRVDEGRGAEAREIGALRYDPEGRVTAFLRPDGSPVKIYEPHNCERVAGLCEYRVISNGVAAIERRIGGLDGGTWSFSIFVERDGVPRLEKVGTIAYDADGVVVDELWIEGETGEEGGARRID